ncbi:MAG: hypothetical protein Q8J64_04905 [Thermodesulfovibrionales bacterium]|nr:hypothetical protein [Thermodesulfovibrionales bacterium]
MKLGEALVKEGFITKEHLGRALERQVIFGGRIGTNIVELGILKEGELTAFLSTFFKVSHVKPSELSSVDEETIACISRELAEKYKAVPFKKEKHRLHVAMLDIKNIQSLDELRFMSGYDIIPYISSEIRLLYALEKYYGIKRDVRFISLLDTEEENEEPAKKKSTAPETLLKAKEAFAAVGNRDEVAGILIAEAHRGAKRVLLCMVKGAAEITGWRSKGIEAGGFKTHAAAPSLFHDVLTGKNYYRGPVLQIPGNKDLIDLLGGTPQDSLLVPIILRDRVMALLYADNGVNSVLDANIAYVNTICSLASLAFELLIVKKKIMEL